MVQLNPLKSYVEKKKMKITGTFLLYLLFSFLKLMIKHKLCSNLDSQSKRLEQFCTAQGWIINEIVKECASGLNDNRPKLIKILSERKATQLVVEHKDRLTRFGFNYIKTLYPECEIIVVNESEDKENLLEDFVSLVTSFCARIYGKRRRSKRNTERLIKELNRDDFNRET